MSGWTADTWMAVIAVIISLASAAGAAFAFFVRSTTKDEIEAAIAKAKEESEAAITAAKEDTDKDIAKMLAAMERTRSNVIDHDRRIVTIETMMKTLPTKDDVHRIEMGVERLVGGIEKMSVEVRHLASSSANNGAKLDRLEQQRMEDAKG